jgi:thiamine-phosphate pyrophosphorylase
MAEEEIRGRRHMALPTRIGRLRLPVLCFVASSAHVKDGDVAAAVSDAVAGGATMVMLREPGMAAGTLAQLATRIKGITRGKALLVIHDRVDVAQAVEADGVQLAEDGLPTRAARGLMGKYTVLGRSADDHTTGLQATAEGAEWVLAGPIFKSTSQPGEKPTGSKLIADIVEDSAIPVIAIGGITADNIPEVIKTGAAGIAVLSGIAGADDRKAATEALKAALNEAWSGRPEEVKVSA